MVRFEPRAVVTTFIRFAGFMLVAGLLLPDLLRPAAFGQEPFLLYEFEEEDELFDFFGPPSIIGCGANLPMGSATVDDGELVLTNGAGGASILALLPEIVEDQFPESRDYRVRMRVNFETHTGIFYVFVRTRMGVNLDFDVLDITDELGYPVYLDVPGQVFGVIEESNCNVAVAHPEWQPGNGIWAFQNPGFAIEPGETWYWMEIVVSGEDDGGLVELTAMTWPDEEDPPDEPQYVLEDLDGLLHTDTTRDPSREVQILLLNLFGSAGQTVRVDDLTVTSLDEVVGDGPFIRADSNSDGEVNITDGVATLNWLFQGDGGELPCKEAADVNNDGEINLSDPVTTFNFLFGAGDDPEPPYPECGTVSAEGSLGCTEPLQDCG